MCIKVGLARHSPAAAHPAQPWTGRGPLGADAERHDRIHNIACAQSGLERVVVVCAAVSTTSTTVLAHRSSYVFMWTDRLSSLLLCGLSVTVSVRDVGVWVRYII